jgi:hypothetical protein
MYDAADASAAKSHVLCAVVFQKMLIYDRTRKKYDRLPG